MCIRVSRKDSSVFDYIKEREVLFVEEIAKYDNTLFVGRKTNGWLILPAEKYTADWSIFRLIGNVEIAFEYLPYAIGVVSNLENSGDLRILIEDSVFFKHKNNFEHLNFDRTLALFSSSGCTKAEELLSPFQIKTSNNSSCLVCGENEAGFVLFNCCSIHYFDVYIEIKEAYRGKGLGSMLLSNTASLVEKKGKKIVYWVEEDNLASIKTVLNAGFERIEKFRVFRL